MCTSSFNTNYATRPEIWPQTDARTVTIKGTLRRRLTYIFFSFNKKFNISQFHLQSLDSQFLL